MENKLSNKSGISKFALSKAQLIGLLFLCLPICLQIYDTYYVIKERQFNSWNPNKMSLLFLLGSVFVLLSLLIVSVYTIKKNIKIHNLYFFSVLIFGLAYMLVFLPFTVPDELSHYASAYKMSNYFLFNFDQAGQKNVIMRESDKFFFEKVFSHVQSADYYRILLQRLDLFSAENALSEITYPTAIKNAPFGYIISGIAVTIARIFRLSPVLTFYSGRIFNLLAYTTMTYFAIKRIPYGKMAIFAISMLPMTLHLICSYSYDFLAISAAMLFVSQVLYMREKKTAITFIDILLCSLWGIILAPTKLVYTPILLFVFIIPKEKFNMSAKKAFLCKSAILLAGAICLLVFQGARAASVTTNTVGGASGGAVYSVGWILENPLETVRIFVNTILNSSDSYILTMVGGSLAWFQVNVGMTYYLPFYGVILYCFLKRDNEPFGLDTNSKIWTFLVFVATYLLTLLSMFVAWTDMGKTTIQGIQGRYFLPVILLVCLIVRNKFVTIKNHCDKYMIIFVWFWQVFVLMEYFVSSFI